MARSTVRVAFLVLLLAFFAVLVGAIIRPFFAYLLGTVLLAFVLFPLHRRLSAFIDDRISAMILLIVSVLAIFVPVVLLTVTLPTDATELSRMLERIVTQTPIERRLEQFLGFDVPLQSMAADAPRRIADFVIGDISNILSAVTHAFLGIALSLFLLYYLLKDGEQLVTWVTEMTPLRPDVQKELFEEMSTTTWAVLKGHVLVAVVQGIVAGVGLWVVGIPHVVFWTVVMTFLELFPIVGVAAVLGPATLYLAFTGQILLAVFLFVYGLTAVAVVDDYFRALVVDRESSLHSGVILLGVFGGVYVFGVMGLFYGPIILGVFQTVVQLFNKHYGTESR